MTNKNRYDSYYFMKKYFNNKGQLHCIDGPAVIYNNGTKVWYKDGKKHRINGPAFIGPNGTKSWWIEGENYTEHQFNKQRINSIIPNKMWEI